jgi:hypothetical protein
MGNYNVNWNISLFAKWNLKTDPIKIEKIVPKGCPNDKIKLLADSVRLSLFIVGWGKGKLPSTYAQSVALSSVKHLNITMWKPNFFTFLFGSAEQVLSC